MDPLNEKLLTANTERERYLSKLKEKADRRENERGLRDRAIQERAEHEEKSSQQFLKQINRRTEFRGRVKNVWLESHKVHEEMHQQLGKLYRERLTWHVGRTLESASLRTGVNRKAHDPAQIYVEAQHMQPAPQPAPRSIPPASQTPSQTALSAQPSLQAQSLKVSAPTTVSAQAPTSHPASLTIPTLVSPATMLPTQSATAAASTPAKVDDHSPDLATDGTEQIHPKTNDE